MKEGARGVRQDDLARTRRPDRSRAKVSKNKMRSLNIKYREISGEWRYAIAPK